MPASKSKYALKDLHFVIKVNHQNGMPVYLMIMMDLMNRLHIEQTQELPAFKVPPDLERGIPMLDMTNFKRVELVQVLDEVPKLKEAGSHLLGTIFKTEVRVWDIIRQKKSTVSLDSTHESHLLFDINYEHDTVNLLSLYNHQHNDEVIAMIIKHGGAAQILLFDIRMEAIELTRQTGQESFVRFLKNFREGFVHFAESHYPDGYVIRTERNIGDYLRSVRFELPEHMPLANKMHIQRVLRHLYALKIILSASLLDRTDPATPAFQQAKRYFEKYAPPNIDDPETIVHPTLIRMRNRNRLEKKGGNSTMVPSVIFGLPQLEDLFDEHEERPLRAYRPKKQKPSVRTKTTARSPQINRSIKIDYTDIPRPRRNDHVSIKVGKTVDRNLWEQIVIEPDETM